MVKPEEADTAKEEGKRERSTIEFPYMGLEDAMAVAKGIHDTTGSSVCQHDQLAAALGLSMNSSGYRMRLSAARLFGVIDADRGGGGVKLTDLGQTIADPTRQREAKARAFLNVPLFKKLYENNRGKMLPPAAALEREMAGLGVAQKQTERARQVFQRSAEVAGFFEMDRSRLIMPVGVGETNAPVSEEKKEIEKPGNGGGNKPPPGMHPFIEGLLKTLPPPQTEWSIPDRVKWLQAASHIFDLIYTGDGGRVRVDVDG
jgi:hypothetical protein